MVIYFLTIISLKSDVSHRQHWLTENEVGFEYPILCANAGKNITLSDL
jgi:hypothetical protein